MVEITRLFWKKVVTSDAFVLGEIHTRRLRHWDMAVDEFLRGFEWWSSKETRLWQPFLGQSNSVLARICCEIHWRHSSLKQNVCWASGAQRMQTL